MRIFTILWSNFQNADIGRFISLRVLEESTSIVINNKYRTLAGWQGGTHIPHRTALLSLTICHSLHKYIFIYFGYWLYLFNIMVASPTGMSIKLIVTLRKSNPTQRFFSVFLIERRLQCALRHIQTKFCLSLSHCTV